MLLPPCGASLEPIKQAHSPQLAAVLASVYKMSNIPYGRRFPAACCRVFNIDHNTKPSISMHLYSPQKMPCAILMIFNTLWFLQASIHPLLSDAPLFEHLSEMLCEFHQ
jgi:hypothetical protein